MQTWQFETGFQYYRDFELDDILLPSLTIRKAVSENLELRFTIDYEPMANAVIEYNNQFDLIPLGLFLKQKIYETNNEKLQLAWMGGLAIPTSIFNSNHTQLINTEQYLLIQYNFNDFINLNSNLGYLYYDFNMTHLSACVNFNPHPKWSQFIEYYQYTNFNNIQVEHGVDAGIMYLPTTRTQLDFSGGISYVRNEINYFALIGFTYLTHSSH